MSQNTNVGFSVLFRYGIGFCGLWMLWQALLFFLVNFFVPPAGEGMPILISQGSLLLFFNAMALIVLFTRFLDLVTDPIIGNLSDRHVGSRGRRIPFLKIGSLSAFLFILIFIPLTEAESTINSIWLALILSAFYIVFTCYFIPYYALINDIGTTNADRVNFSTSAGLFGSIGLVIAAQMPLLWKYFEGAGYSVLHAKQYSFACFGVVAFLFMLVPIFTLRESREVPADSDSLSLKETLKYLSKNKYFGGYFLIMLLYYLANAIFGAGMPYLYTVLLELDAVYIAKSLPLIVLVSLVVFPVTNFFAKRIGKRFLLSIAMFFLAVGFFAGSYIGYFPASKVTQGYLIAAFFGLPIGMVTVLIVAICSDIAEHSRLCKKLAIEGAIFAGKNIALKLGAVIGITFFASFTLLGKDIGNDFGLRSMNFLCGALCFLGAFLVFKVYDEVGMFKEIEEAKSSSSDL